VFRRHPAADNSPAAPATVSSGQVPWNYDRTEIVADGIVHGTGIILGLIGTVAILAVASKLKSIELAPILIYSLGLLVMLAISAAWQHGRSRRREWLLRRFDHSAIIC
jgi:hemolysin III